MRESELVCDTLCFVAYYICISVINLDRAEGI